MSPLFRRSPSLHKSANQQIHESTKYKGKRVEVWVYDLLILALCHSVQNSVVKIALSFKP